MSSRFSESSKDYIEVFLMKALKKLIHRVHFRGELLHNENRSYVALYVDNYLLKS